MHLKLVLIIPPDVSTLGVFFKNTNINIWSYKYKVIHLSKLK